jgi:hypothetical protein
VRPACLNPVQFVPTSVRHANSYDLYTRQPGLEENLFLAPGEGDKVEDKNGGPRGGGGGVPDAVSLIRGQGF